MEYRNERSTPLTCHPLFAKNGKGKGGNDILSMYEYEEIRGVVYSVEFTLVEAELLARVNIINTKDTETYTYWWSNIAVSEQGNRVYVPADETYVTSYRDGGYKISKAPVTEQMSFPRHTGVSKDYFYDIPKESKKWIACLDGKGVGLFHTSTDNLIGRKTFLWGTGHGGEHWNSRLCNKGNYIEVQAGLCKTQFEHIVLGPREKICFVENYSLVDIGESSYTESVKKLSEIAKSKNVSELPFEKCEYFAPEIFGSPRGFLTELLRGEKMHPELDFPKESLTPEFEYYYSLIVGKECVGDADTAFVSDPLYRKLIKNKSHLTEFDYYILSLIDYANGEFESSVEMINKSLSIRPREYSVAAATLIARYVETDMPKAYELAKEACRMNPEHLQTVCLFAEICTAAKKYEEFVEFYNQASELVRREGRVRMFVGKCLIELDRIEEAEMFINKDLLLPNLREGEYSITNLWVEMYRKKIASALGTTVECVSTERVLSEYPIPYEIDFRMH